MDGSLDTQKPTLDLASYTRQRHAFEHLEARITELWGHLNAATFRFLTLVAEFDRTKCYERHGLVNTAQWLNWQCGIGTVAAREKVRVARALEDLPQISAAFARGEVSYSKVRAMTRVATAANESVLVSVALHGTAAHVEKLVRKPGSSGPRRLATRTRSTRTAASTISSTPRACSSCTGGCRPRSAR